MSTVFFKRAVAGVMTLLMGSGVIQTAPARAEVISTAHITTLPDLRIEEIAENEYRATVGSGKSRVEIVGKKSGDRVTYQAFVGGELVLIKTRSLAEATTVGDGIRSEAKPPPGTQKLPSDPGGIPQGDYYFDGTVVYHPTSRLQPYAHPDKEYYGISPFSTWSMRGIQNLHIQLSYYNSQSILGAPAWMAGGAIGAAVGYLFTHELTGAIIGAIIGGALGAIFNGQLLRLADEDGCMWFVMDANPPLMNLGSALNPIWFLKVRYIGLGPFSRTNYYYPI